jgi:hypothetical protein
VTAKKKPKDPKLVDLYDVAHRMVALRRFAWKAGVGSMSSPYLSNVPRAVFDLVDAKESAHENDARAWWSKTMKLGDYDEILLTTEEPPVCRGAEERPAETGGEVVR